MKRWKPKLSFKEITFEFLQEFHKYGIEQGNLEATVFKKHANLKFLLGIALIKGKIDKNPYDDFPIKKITRAQNNDILTEEELKILQNTYDNNQYAAGKKDVLRNFLFCCYTGLSFIDLSTVTFSDLTKIKIKNKGEFLILRNNRTKNGNPYKIPIVSPTVRSILGSGSPTNSVQNL